MLFPCIPRACDLYEIPGSMFGIRIIYISMTEMLPFHGLTATTPLQNNAEHLKGVLKSSTNVLPIVVKDIS